MGKLQYIDPETLNVDPERLKLAGLMLKEAVDAKETPGAVGLVLYKKSIIAHYCYGLRALFPEPSMISLDTVYDLASLTKCVATTTMALMLLERGAFRLDDSIYTFLPTFKDKNQIRIRHLLTHTSGYPAWLPLQTKAFDRESLKSLLADISLDYETGSKVVYSCIGFILLGLILESLANEPLDSFLKRELFEPLQMNDTGYNIALNKPDLLIRTAPTEFSAEKKRILLGEVHDENAFSIGGVSGNAGLFSTAGDLAIFSAMMLSEGSWNNKKYLSDRTIHIMQKNHTSHLNEPRGLGWAKTEEFSSGGDLLSKESYGHTGFTGTSIWIDPKLDLGLILLTNRVHPTREGGNGIFRLRACFANTVVSALPKR